MATAFYLPKTVKEACALLGEWGERVVITNGGTDIVIEIGKGRLVPEANVCIRNIEELHAIRQEGEFLSIGGAATFDEMLASPLVKAFPGMIEAAGVIGSPAIRAMGTLAGNICTAAPAPDGCTMAMGLDARVVLRSAAGERTVPLSEMLLGRGKTARRGDELLTQILLPLSKTACAYQRLARRQAQDIAKVMVGASLETCGGVITAAAVALGAVNAVPCRAPSVEEMLVGKPAAEGLEAVRDFFPPEAKLRPSPFREYKQQVLPTLLFRTLEQAAERGGGR
ncbi:MAG: FAD binding domain-containing protein [Lachnospiraceae bacterium]|nr:FAD binding domain-containing protein [Lachnospiraceae bacterium]